MSLDAGEGVCGAMLATLGPLAVDLVRACETIMGDHCFCGSPLHGTTRDPTIHEWQTIQRHLKGLPWNEAGEDHGVSA